MPLAHSRATAPISVTGLALGCLNPATRNWEVAIIRAPGHVLRITVNKKAADGTSSDVTFEIDNRHRIFITAANAVVPQSVEDQLFRRDPFDRLNPGASDLEDIRFLVDFEREFNNSQPLELLAPAAAGQTSITELFVSQPVLYSNPGRQLDNMRLVNLTNQQVTNFGTVAQICNADIECNEGGAVILQIDGPLGFSMHLPRIQGMTHNVIIDNSCPPGEVAQGQPTDFNRYFDVIRLPNGDTFDLRTNSAQEGSGAVCNKGMVTSRDRLLPL
jgi:hypothetical protein